MKSVTDFAGLLAHYIFNPLLILIFGAGVVVFVYGLVEYLYALNVKGEQSEEGKKHMFWGLVGLFIMVAALTIIKLVANTIGTDATNQLPNGY